MGRPSDFTEEIAAAICTRLAMGESLRKICLDDNMPAMSTIFNWLGTMPSFVEQYTIAREAQAETHADAMTDIADEPPPLDQFGKVDGGAVQHQRLRIETRKWIASKLKPKKYGERIAHEHSGHIEQMSDEQLNAKIAAMQAGQDDAAGA